MFTSLIIISHNHAANLPGCLAELVIYVNGQLNDKSTKWLCITTENVAIAFKSTPVEVSCRWLV